MKTRTFASAGIITAGTIAMTSALLLVPKANGSAAPHEDEPMWNCYTQGNLDCGPSPVVTLPDGTEVAVLEPANDGNVYGSARDGRVYRLNWTEVTA